MVLSLLAMAQALRVWEWRPGTPLSLTGDAPWVATLIRGYLDRGPYADNPLFGAPYVLNTGWSSTGNDIHVWILSALRVVSSDPYTVMAIYFVAVFPLSALTMYWLCRRYDVVRPAAVMAGVLFSVVPGQQERFVHLFLAAYWAVPFAAWLLIETASGRSVLSRREGWRASGWRLQRPRLSLVLVVLMCVSVGLGDVYYVAFTLVLALPVIALRQVRHVDVRELGRLLLPLVVTVLPTAISLAAARSRADRDVLTGGLPFGRSFADTERWSGQLVDLVLPWSGHRIAAWAARAASYDGLTGTVGEVSSIGLVAVLGLAGVLACSAAVLLRQRSSRTADPFVLRLAVLCVLALAFFTRGGLGALTALLLTPQIRTWSRLFLFVALFGLLAVAWGLTQLFRREHLGRRGVVVASVLLAGVGVLDQTNPDRAPDWAANRASLAVVTQFDDDVERALGPGCSVFVLPIAPFPEVDETPWRRLMTLGVASHDLRWSFGAIKGTLSADWQRGLGTDDPDRLVRDLASVGYCGVVVDESLARQHPELASALPGLLGPAVARSSDGHDVAYTLRPTRAEMQARVGASGLAARARAVLHPVVASLTGAWYLGEPPARRYPLGPGPAVRVTNMSQQPAPVTLELDLLGPATGSESLTVAAPGAAPHSVRLGPRQRTRVVLSLTAGPGTTAVTIMRAAVDPDWSAYADHSALTSIEAMRLVANDATVNTGVDLPTP